MINIKDDKYVKLLSVNLFLDENVFEKGDPFELKEVLEATGLFAPLELNRTLLFKLDGGLARGASNSKGIREKVLNAIDSSNVSTVRFMQNEALEIDNQSSLEVYFDQWDGGSKIHFLSTNLDKYKECQIAIAELVVKYKPQYAFANLYILDHFDIDKATGIGEINLINEQYPVDSLNISRYQGLAKDGKIKDAQWINYFSDQLLSHIKVHSPDKLHTSTKIDSGRFVQISESPFFSKSDIEWIYKFRKENADHIVLR